MEKLKRNQSPRFFTSRVVVTATDANLLWQEGMQQRRVFEEIKSPPYKLKPTPEKQRQQLLDAVRAQSPQLEVDNESLPRFRSGSCSPDLLFMSSRQRFIKNGLNKIRQNCRREILAYNEALPFPFSENDSLLAPIHKQAQREVELLVENYRHFSV